MAVLLCDVLFFLGFVGWSREKWRTKRRGCDKGAKQSPGLWLGQVAINFFVTFFICFNFCKLLTSSW